MLGSLPSFEPPLRRELGIEWKASRRADTVLKLKRVATSHASIYAPFRFLVQSIVWSANSVQRAGQPSGPGWSLAARAALHGHGQTSRIRRSFQSDAEARAVIKHILAVSGLAGAEDRIVVRASAETDAAEAFIEKDERLIFYNAEFMTGVARKDYWSMVAILVHGVGHHIRMLTVIPGRDHEFETRCARAG